MTELALSLMLVSRLLVFALGAAITVLAVGAYRRRPSDYLRNAAVGFAIVTLGVFVEGALYHVVGVDLVTVHIVESLLVSAGFAVIIASLR